MLNFIKSFFRNPAWIPQEALAAKKYEDFSREYLDGIRERLQAVQSDQPQVSIILTVFNEETNAVRCLDTLSRTRSRYPLEIVMVNNNSSDRTVEALEYLGLKVHHQKVQGSGPARQMGMEKSRGQYILLGDADCLYPHTWVNKMIDTLRKKNTAVVYGRYCFISDRKNPRWQLSLYEMLRDISMEIRHPKRPFLNSYGISMAYYREQGMKEGYIQDKRRGNDGRMCYDLMKYGRVRRMRSYNAAAWTGTRTLFRDGSFAKALWKRILLHLASLDQYFKRLPQHDTKTSTNPDDSIEASWKRLKSKIQPTN